MIQPTSYLSPEECAKGEGLRILSDDRFYVVPVPDPLPAAQLGEIEQALQRRIVLEDIDEPLFSPKRLYNAFFLWRYFRKQGDYQYSLWTCLTYYRRWMHKKGGGD